VKGDCAVRGIGKTARGLSKLIWIGGRGTQKRRRLFGQEIMRDTKSDVFVTVKDGGQRIVNGSTNENGDAVSV